MTRKEFLINSLLMGIGLPLLTTAMASTKRSMLVNSFQTQDHFSGKIIIVGAGAAGMAAGYLLKKHRVDFMIIEAAPQVGGRIKKASDFVDFPIDLGAEWIHVSPSSLAEIIGIPFTESQADIMEYNPKSIATWKKDKLKSRNYLKGLFSEWKFKHTTWYDFFEQYIVPSIADHIVLSTPIASIAYQEKTIKVTSTKHDIFEADKVLLTVPIKILQNEQIQFLPPLPTDKTEAIHKVFMGDGIKVFIAFKEKFYPDMLAFGNMLKALQEEEKFWYDAALGKETKTHVLGLFAINEKARAYTTLSSEKEIIQQLLEELDQMCEGKASANYQHHIIQNWSNEPYIQGAYSYSFDGNQEEIVNTIARPVQNKLYFAGEAFSIKHQATVQGACNSGYSVITQLLKEG